jgi:hypothetical protein
VGYPLNIENDFDLFDNTELVTVLALDGNGKVLATYYPCNMLGSPEPHALEDIEGAQVAVVSRHLELQAKGSFLVNGVLTVNPLTGITLIQGFAIVTGPNSITPNLTYIIQSASLVSWATRWECETTRVTL